MKKNSVVSLALSVALSLSALSVVCATDRDVVMSAEITPELRQIQHGVQIVLRTGIKNTDAIAGNVEYQVIRQDAKGNEISSMGSSTDLESGEEASFATTFNKDELGAGGKFIIVLRNDNDDVLSEEEVLLDGGITMFAANASETMLPIDEEMDLAWTQISNADEHIDPQQSRASGTSLTSRTRMYYGSSSSSGYYEGLFQAGKMNFESVVTNHGNSSEKAICYMAQYTSDNVLKTISNMLEKTISPGVSEPIAPSFTMSNSLYNEVGSVKYYTWNDSMVPCGDAATYTKGSHNDNFVVGSSILTKADYYPLFTGKSIINGSLKTSSDVDVIAYKASSTKTVTIGKTSPGGTFKVDVYNSSGSLQSSNPTSFSAKSGSTYYLRISGTKAGNYKVTIQ